MEHLESSCVRVFCMVVNTIGINWYFPSHSECVLMVALIMMSLVNDDEWLSNYLARCLASHSMFMLINVPMASIDIAALNESHQVDGGAEILYNTSNT